MLHNTVNVLTTTELVTLKWLILCYFHLKVLRKKEKWCKLGSQTAWLWIPGLLYDLGHFKTNKINKKQYMELCILDKYSLLQEETEFPPGRCWCLGSCKHSFPLFTHIPHFGVWIYVLTAFSSDLHCITSFAIAYLPVFHPSDSGIMEWKDHICIVSVSSSPSGGQLTHFLTNIYWVFTMCQALT